MQQSYLPSPAPAMSSGKAGTGAALFSRLVWMCFLSSSVIQQRHQRNDISLNLPSLVCFGWGKKMLCPTKKSPTSTIPGGLRGEGFQGFSEGFQKVFRGSACSPQRWGGSRAAKAFPDPAGPRGQSCPMPDLCQELSHHWKPPQDAATDCQ